LARELSDAKRQRRGTYLPNAASAEEGLNHLGNYYRELNALMNPSRSDRLEPAESPRPNSPTSTAPARRESFSQPSGLQSSTLQPASGLQSTSRGLTPESEWRRTFPKKPNGSPR
jgi:hypothetical protein